MNQRPLLTALLGVLVCAVAWFGLQQIDAGRITQAAEATEAGNLDEALTLLEADGAMPRSAASFHDAGVVWYRAGDVPRAIASWRAARTLAPRDPDLVHNLAVARSELSGTPPPAPTAYGWMDVLTPGEVGGLALLAWLVTSSALMGWRRRGEGLESALVAGTLAVVLSVMGWMGRDAVQHHPTAVTVDAAVIRDGPDLDAGERFSLNPGAELITHDVRGPFVLIEDGDGRRGWALKGQLAIGATDW